MTKCINSECILKHTCARFEVGVGLRQPVLYPDGGVNCTKYDEKGVEDGKEVKDGKPKEE